MAEEFEQRIHGWLREHVGSMGLELARRLRARIGLYEGLPESVVVGHATAFIELLIAALASGDASAVIAASSRNIKARYGEALALEQGLQFTLPLRLTFWSALAPAIEQRVQGACEIIAVAEAIFEQLDAISVGFYQDKLKQASRALLESEERHRKLVELSPDGIAVLQEGRFLYVNPAGATMLGKPAREGSAGAEVTSLVPPERSEDWMAELAQATGDAPPLARSEKTWRLPGGQSITVELLGAPIVFDGKPALQIVFRDVTERKQTELALERSARQEEHIRAQELMLQELSTPLIPVGKDVVVMPLIGALNEARAAHMLSVLLDGVVTHRAAVAILDITGVPHVDEKMAEALFDAIRAARLLGAEVVLSGIKPEAAQTFVHIGADFGGIVTKSTLKHAIAYALRKAG
jgi:PAS domain S-box-containing protein